MVRWALVCMQSYILMCCSILEEGSALNIRIYQRHSLWKEVLICGQVSEDEPLCEAAIKFDDLWKHLVSELQKKTKCKSIFASIASDILRTPQQTSRRISSMQFQDCSSGLSLRYALNHFQHEDSLLKFNHRPSTLLWPHCMYSSKARSRTWTSSGPFWMVLDPQAMVWRWVFKLERLSAG